MFFTPKVLNFSNSMDWSLPGIEYRSTVQSSHSKSVKSMIDEAKELKQIIASKLEINGNSEKKCSFLTCRYNL